MSVLMASRMFFFIIIVLPFVTGTGCPFPASVLRPILGRSAVRLGSVDSRPQVQNLNLINMQSLSNVAGFSALVLLGSAVAVPGLSVLFALCGVASGALWVLNQCSPSTPQE